MFYFRKQGLLSLNCFILVKNFLVFISHFTKCIFCFSTFFKARLIEAFYCPWLTFIMDNVYKTNWSLKQFHLFHNAHYEMGSGLGGYLHFEI